MVTDGETTTTMRLGLPLGLSTTLQLLMSMRVGPDSMIPLLLKLTNSRCSDTNGLILMAIGLAMSQTLHFRMVVQIRGVILPKIESGVETPMEMDGLTQLQIGQHTQLEMLTHSLTTLLNGEIAMATASAITHQVTILTNALENTERLPLTG